MTTRAGTFVLAWTALIAAAAGAATAPDVDWGSDVPVTLPGIFAKAGPKARLAAEEAARHDAYRKLVEHVYGLTIDSTTDVRDLVLEHRDLRAAFEAQLLRGAKEIGRQHTEDGRVSVALKVTVRQVVEVVKKTCKRVRKDDRLVSEETIEDVRRRNDDADVVVIGRAALHNSPGLSKVRAMRAAEADCYERIAARVFGLRINAHTTVRDLVLENDLITSKVEGVLLDGVRFGKPEFRADGVCRVTGELRLRDVVEALTRVQRRSARGGKVNVEEIENIARENRDVVITEVGQGAPRAAANPTPSRGPAATGRPAVFEEKTTVIRRPLGGKSIVTGG